MANSNFGNKLDEMFANMSPIQDELDQNQAPISIKELLEKVTKGLEHCVKLTVCSGCPYSEERLCDETLFVDSITLIEMLRKERDAIFKDWLEHTFTGKALCNFCRFNDNGKQCLSTVECDDGERFEWRGVCVENTK